MSSHYAWPLPEANATTVRDLTVTSVSSLPLPLMVCSCNQEIHWRGVRQWGIHHVNFHWTWSFSTCANLKCMYSLVMIKSIKTSNYDQTYWDVSTQNKWKKAQTLQMKPHESGMLPFHVGFRLRWKSLGSAPMKLILYLRRFWTLRSHSTSSTHLGGGILLQGLKLSTSFLEIWWGYRFTEEHNN